MYLIEAVLGLAVVALSYVWASQTETVVAHVLFPLGVWLAFDGLGGLQRGTSTIRDPGKLIGALFVGTIAGIVVDAWVVLVTETMRYAGVGSVFNALLLYLGRGFALLAVYTSFQVVLNLGVRRNSYPPGEEGPHLLRPPWHGWGYALLDKEQTRDLWLPFVATGCSIGVIPLFMRMHYPHILSWWVVAAFAGWWLFLEGLLLRRDRRGPLALWLQGRGWPSLAIVPPALLFGWGWERLNLLTGTWAYQNLFWLETRIGRVPLAVLMGYVAWYVVFLCLYEITLGSALSTIFRMRRRHRHTAEADGENTAVT